MKKRLFIAAAAALVLASCGRNGNEQVADRITRAVIANDMTPVVNDFDPSIRGQLTRVRVAELSDELNAQGAYEGLKPDTSWCRTGYLCYDVAFKNRPYREVMRVDSDGKVNYWWIHAAPQSHT